MVSTAYMKENGLFHGKMGIVLFFMHYSRYRNSTDFENFANMLLDEIFEDVVFDMPIDFEDGLSGIGWGIEYLLEHNFVGGNTFDILEDIDSKLSAYNFFNYPDRSFRRGTEGVFCYLRKHLSGKVLEKEKKKKEYLKVFSKYLLALDNEDVFELKSFLADCDFDINLPISKWRLGIDNGCAGYGLKLMLG